MNECAVCKSPLQNSDYQTKYNKHYFHLKCMRKLRKKAKKTGGNLDLALKELEHEKRV